MELSEQYDSRFILSQHAFLRQQFAANICKRLQQERTIKEPLHHMNMGEGIAGRKTDWRSY
jgi:hypothetical protein